MRKQEKHMSKYHKRASPSAELSDKKPTREEIQEAIWELARMGLSFDSGERRWSQQTGRYEIVWKSKIYKGLN